MPAYAEVAMPFQIRQTAQQRSRVFLVLEKTMSSSMCDEACALQLNACLTAGLQQLGTGLLRVSGHFPRTPSRDDAANGFSNFLQPLS